MKKIIAAAAIVITGLTAFAKDPGINEKVLEAFNKTFQDAREVNWIEKPASYEVNFKQYSIRVRVNYDREGNILNTLRYYGEEQLPLMVLSKLKTKYASMKIFGVTEISSSEGTFFHVVLEDDKKWLEVKADITGAMTVEKKLKKG